jgi:uncharacterized protein
MEYKSVKGYNGWGQIGFLIMFTGIGFILALMLQIIIGFALVPKGTELEKIPEAMSKAISGTQNVNVMRIMQVLSTLLMLALPAWVFKRLCHSKHWLWLGFSKYFNTKQVLLGVILIFCANVVAQPLAEFTKFLLQSFPGAIKTADSLEKIYAEGIMVMSNLSGWGEYFISIIIIAFFPAVFEEMFFRGALQSTLYRWWKNDWAAIIVASIAFSIIHFSIYLFLSRFLLGVALGWIFCKSRNVWIGILIHFVNNTFALTQAFYLKQTGGKVDISKLENDFPWWGVLMGLAVLIISSILFDRVSSANANTIRIKEESLYTQLNPVDSIASSFQINNNS